MGNVILAGIVGGVIYYGLTSLPYVWGMSISILLLLASAFVTFRVLQSADRYEPPKCISSAKSSSMKMEHTKSMRGRIHSL